MRKFLLVGLSAFLVAPLTILLTGCGGSSLVMKDGAVPPASPLHLIATVSKENPPVFTDALTEALSQAGYGILSSGRTISLFRKLGLEPDDLSDPQVLANLKERRIDAVMTLSVEAITDRRGRTLLDKVDIRVMGTKEGEQFSTVEWNNSWGCAPGSPCDRANRMSPSEAAAEIAQALVRQLGPPGQKATVFMDDLLPGRKTSNTSSASAGTQPPTQMMVQSDVDKPEYTMPENPNNFAVIVGVDKYESLPAAEYAERDAEAVRAHLTAMGYPTRNIYYLSGQQATRAKLAQSLNTWLPNRVDEDSTVFFYYSGHGAPDPKTGEAYLVPVDGDPEDLDSTAYPIKQLYEKLGKLKAHHVIVALDSCFSGAGGRSVIAKGTRPLISIVDIGTLPNNVIALTASDKSEISGTIEDQGHGAFTYYMLKGLSGAAKTDSGHVTVQSLYDYLTPKVQNAARLHNRDQTPQLLPAAASTAVSQVQLR
jgi:hypothetical protein